MSLLVRPLQPNVEHFVKKFIVTGGAGFIGSHLTDALLKDEAEVLVIDDMSTGHHENINPKAELERMDIQNANISKVFKAFAPDCVYHLAAQADPKRAVREPGFDANTNILGTINITLASIEAECQHLIFTSTGGAMYGTPDADSLPVAESHPPSPTSPYGLSKFCAELYIRQIASASSLNYSILRPANVYGPRQDPASEVGVVLILLEELLAGRTPTLRGFGSPTRDYIYVTDLVSALLSVADSHETGPFHVGSGTETSVDTIFSKIANRLNCPTEAHRVPLLPGEVENMALDSTKAKKSLGWLPRVSLDEGLDLTVAWAKSH